MILLQTNVGWMMENGVEVPPWATPVKVPVPVEAMDELVPPNTAVNALPPTVNVDDETEP